MSTPAPTPLVDVHAHFVTDAYVAAARAAGHEHPDGMPAWPSWTLDGQLALMDSCGIGRSVLSISSSTAATPAGPRPPSWARRWLRSTAPGRGGGS